MGLVMAFVTDEEIMEHVIETTTKYRAEGPRKYWGWCREVDVEHHWDDGPLLTSYPPIQTRWCINCGKRQQFSPGEWRDVD